MGDSSRKRGFQAGAGMKLSGSRQLRCLSSPTFAGIGCGQGIRLPPESASNSSAGFWKPGVGTAGRISTIGSGLASSSDSTEASLLSELISRSRAILVSFLYRCLCSREQNSPSVSPLSKPSSLPQYRQCIQTAYPVLRWALRGASRDSPGKPGKSQRGARLCGRRCTWSLLPRILSIRFPHCKGFAPSLQDPHWVADAHLRRLVSRPRHASGLWPTIESANPGRTAMGEIAYSSEGIRRGPLPARGRSPPNGRKGLQRRWKPQRRLLEGLLEHLGDGRLGDAPRNGELRDQHVTRPVQHLLLTKRQRLGQLQRQKTL